VVASSTMVATKEFILTTELFMRDTGVCQPKETAEQLAIHTAVHGILHKALDITWTERILSTLRS